VAEPSRGSPHLGAETRSFVTALEAWVGSHCQLLAALMDMRQRGVDVGPLLSSRPVAVVRRSWDLWDELRLADGADPDAELTTALGAARLGALRYMLWGRSARDEIRPHDDQGLRLER
jgi:hypothetical protein